MSYSSNPNCNYASGERNVLSKLKQFEVDKIRTMSVYKEKRIEIIDAEIENLKRERERLRREYSQNQLALDFNVAPITIRRIQKGESWA